MNFFRNILDGLTVNGFLTHLELAHRNLDHEIARRHIHCAAKAMDKIESRGIEGRLNVLQWGQVVTVLLDIQTTVLLRWPDMVEKVGKMELRADRWFEEGRSRFDRA